jgi:hypothetical protein
VGHIFVKPHQYGACKYVFGKPHRFGSKSGLATDLGHFFSKPHRFGFIPCIILARGAGESLSQKCASVSDTKIACAGLKIEFTIE